MPALAELVVVDELAVGLLGPALRRLVDLVGEGADCDGDLKAPDVKEATLRDPSRVPVEARRAGRWGDEFQGNIICIDPDDAAAWPKGVPARARYPIKRETDEILQALGLSKDDLIQALGLSFTVSTIALAAGLARGGAFHLGNITLSALAVIPSLLGMGVGTAVRERISAATFRRWFLIFLAMLGLELVVRPLFL